MKRNILLIAISIFLALWIGVSFASDDDGIRVYYTEQSITLDPASDIWKEAEPFTVQLIALEVLDHMGAMHAPRLPQEFINSLHEATDFVLDLSREAPTVSVKALHNGEKVAIQLSWVDKTEDVENALDTYRDALAVLFPVNMSSGYNPSPLMGSKGEPVNVWQWRSEWQAEFEGRRNLEARQPLTEGVWISPVDKILKEEHPGMYERVEYIAEGYSTLTKQTQQDVDAQGRYWEGRWTVVFVRDVKRTDLSDAEFKPGKQTYMNMAVWNGHEGNVDGMKSISLTWTPLKFDPVPSHAKR